MDCQHTVREISLAQPFLAKSDTLIPDLVDDFMHTGATKALVIDAEGRLAGMVTVFDLLKGQKGDA
jgi:CBS domain containing-hemolysin-like protein